MSEKKILDITCGSRSIWFNKNHPAAIYCDKRQEEHYNVWKNDNGKAERACVISPDVVCDFTSLPFEDNSFSLVVFDPPHLTSAKETSWLVKKYSKLDETWPQMLHDGFKEAMRVLKPDGHTVHDFDRRFALEDEGIINPIHPFRWAMLDGDVQLRF